MNLYADIPFPDTEAGFRSNIEHYQKQLIRANQDVVAAHTKLYVTYQELERRHSDPASPLYKVGIVL